MNAGVVFPAGGKMRRFVCFGMFAFATATLTFSCKRQSADDVSPQAASGKNAQPPSVSRQSALEKGNYFFKVSGIKQKDFENLREFVADNYELFQKTAESGMQQMSSFPKADAEGRVKILTGVFRSFMDAFLPLGAKVFSPQNTAALIQKVKPDVDAFLAGVEQMVRQKLKSPVLNKDEKDYWAVSDMQELFVALDLKMSTDDIASTFGGLEKEQVMSLKAGALESSGSSSFQKDFGKAVPNTSLLAGLFLGIMSTLISYCVIVFGGLAVSAAAPAATLGAFIGIGWVCVVGLWRTFLIATGHL
ncbi:hypothetical protein EBR21_05985 [bacterium]|nr:hypothetical protein [bacterium]